MQFSAKKKITLSFFISAIIIFSFLVLNKALKNNKVYSPILEIGKENYLPDFNLPDLFSTNEVLLSNIIKEKDFSLINIWASWCVPCRDENDLLKSLSNINSLQNIGINYKDRKKNSIKFLKDYGNPFKFNLVDKKGIESINLGAYGVPETFLINKNRKILLKIIGPINNDHINQIIEITNG